MRTIAFGVLGILSFLPLLLGVHIVAGLDPIPVTTPVSLWPNGLWVGTAFMVVGFLGLFAALFGTNDA